MRALTCGASSKSAAASGPLVSVFYGALYNLGWLTHKQDSAAVGALPELLVALQSPEEEGTAKRVGIGVSITAGIGVYAVFMPFWRCWQQRGHSISSDLICQRRPAKNLQGWALSLRHQLGA
jgi:hypothetical protein